MTNKKFGVGRSIKVETKDLIKELRILEKSSKLGKQACICGEAANRLEELLQEIEISRRLEKRNTLWSKSSGATIAYSLMHCYLLSCNHYSLYMILSKMSRTSTRKHNFILNNLQSYQEKLSDQ